MFHKRYDLGLLVALVFTGVNSYPSLSQASADRAAKADDGSPHVETVGPDCASSDENNICLAVKYVVYKDEAGDELLSADSAVDNLKGINDIWSQCQISFQIDQFEAVAPEDLGLSYDPADETELYDIRSQFVDDSTLLLVNTGHWNRYGTLGNTAANAWTNLPGDFPYGVVLEHSVSTFSNIIAHEIGHYLDLLHVDDASDLLNPVIYPESTALSAEQCEIARSTALSSWKKMLR